MWTPGPGPTPGADTYDGDGADDNVSGGDGNDTLNGAGGSDTLNGDAGDDVLSGGDDDASDVIDGGADYDILDYSDLVHDGFHFVAALGRALRNSAATADHFSNIEEIRGSLAGDIIDISGSAVLAARGGGGDDLLIGDNGASLWGDDGNDVFRITANVVIEDFQVGADLFEGASVISFAIDGADTLLSTSAGATVRVKNVNALDLAAWQAHAAHIGVVVGGEGVDEADGGPWSDYFWGGEGNDGIVGASGDDILIGGAGNDLLSGADGEDRMEGGSGDDLFVVEDAGDVVIEHAGGGTDNVLAFVDYTLAAGVEVERLHLTGSARHGVGNEFATTIEGTSGDDVLEGGAGDDTLTGLGGADTLIGGAGADRMEGGDGDDLILVDAAGDAASGEAYLGGADDDILRVTGAGMHDFTGTFAFQVETMQLDGVTMRIEASHDSAFSVITETIAVDGLGKHSTINIFSEGVTAEIGGWTFSNGTFDITMTGSEQDEDFRGSHLGETMIGGGGSDIFHGNGGADILIGGAGDDRYDLDDLLDTIVELDGGGVDKIDAAVAIDLNNYAFVENLELNAGVGLTATGNALDNEIVGSSFVNDTLFGGAGDDYLNGRSGQDTLIGGIGDDEYFVEPSGIDTITENPGEGADTVIVRFTSASFATFSLASVANVENLQGIAISSNISMTLIGNALNNTISAGDTLPPFTNDTLDGGAGDDTLIGVLGNDIYIVDSLGDTVVEETGFGTDTIRTALSSYSLAAANVGAVENLIFTGSGAFNGVGNALNNQITGADGDDFLYGGAGDDTLVGGDGQDYLDSGGGNDNVSGGAGDDFVVAGQGTATYAGGDGYDRITYIGAGTGVSVSLVVTAAQNTNIGMHTLSGFEGLGGSTWADTLTGNDDSHNEIFGAGGDDVIFGLGGVDSVYAGAGDDTVHGGDGADVIYSNDGDDQLFGDDGDDSLYASAGAQTLDGGGGSDYAAFFTSFGFTSGVTIDLRLDGQAQSTPIGSVTLFSIENLYGSAQGDSLTGSAADNWLNGLEGDDTLFGLDGNDTIVGYDGDDVIEGASGTDSLQGGAGADTIDGGDGNDAIFGGDGDDIIRGGEGEDFINAGAGNDIVFVDAIGIVVGDIGDDVYRILALGGIITEGDGQGTDRVEILAGNVFELPGNVENLVFSGTGSFSGTGNALDNQIFGGAGADTLSGAGGADLLSGGDGVDTADYAFASAGVVINLSNSAANAGEAADDTLVSIESVAGSDFSDVLTGNAEGNVLNGRGGADAMTGGDGDDTYIIDASDVIAESAAGGIDRVESRISYTLGDNFENLSLKGAAAINATGNALANTLIGNGGANILDGKEGADIMTGYAGNDVYRVDNADDVVTEGSSVGGIDRVEARVSFTLGANFENLSLKGAASINATGNTLANTLIGNGASNILDGKEGADAMIGYAGNDVYRVDHSGDVVTEGSSVGGTDRVEARVSFILGANVENLSLKGAAAINATGNTLSNTLIGNSAANILDGKAGADIMTGYGGNDIYIVNSAGDVVTEGSSVGGVDRVQSSVSFTLGNNLENLTLTGPAPISATGNTLANRLTGNNAANVLDGLAGADTLTGGGGGDAFVFTTALSPSNIDRITDFVHGADMLHLESDVFTALGADGVLASDAFHLGASAADAGDRILYDSATGVLLYDADGNGAGAAVQFATLGPGLGLTNTDIFVI